MIWGLPPLL